MNENTLLNRILNRSLRVLNELGVALSKSAIHDRKSAIERLATAVEEVAAVQTMVHKEAPNLEYHYDAGRPPTEFMRELAFLIDEARDLEKAGRIEAAVRKLEDARALEPPALTYEMLTKKIGKLKV